MLSRNPIIIISTCNLLSSDWARSCVVIICCDSVECLLRKACCLSVKTEWQSKWFTMLVNIMLEDFATYTSVDVSDMGR